MTDRNNRLYIKTYMGVWVDAFFFFLVSKSTSLQPPAIKTPDANPAMALIFRLETTAGIGIARETANRQIIRFIE